MLFFFFQIFFFKDVNSAMLYSKDCFNFAKLSVLKQFRIAASQGVPGLNRGLSSKFYWSKSANQVKFKEYVICTKRDIFVKKKFSNWLNIGLPKRS